MGQVIIVKYEFENETQLSKVTVLKQSTKCHKCKKCVTATKGEQMNRKFGRSPMKNWARLKEKLSITLLV